MKLKSWIAAGLVFLAASSVWSAYVISRRAFLRDFNTGVHAYLAGHYAEAEQSLTLAVERRPGNLQVQQLLMKSLVEESFAQYHKRDFTGALETLGRAARAAPKDSETQQTLVVLKNQLSTPPDQHPVQMEQILKDLYQRLPEPTQPAGLQSLMEEWLHRSQQNQEAVLKHFWENQETWLIQLQREKDAFQKTFYIGLAVFGFGAATLLVLLLGILHTYFGRRGIFSRMLEDHYRRLLVALPAGTQVLLGPPINLENVPESHQMDSIEAEILSGTPAEETNRRLQSLLEGENPWVRARAAKILYRFNPFLAMNELKRLVGDASNHTQVPGIWALSELATEESLDVLASLAYSASQEIRQGVIRSLLQLQTKESLPEDVHRKLNQLLAEIRTRTGWVF